MKREQRALSSLFKKTPKHKAANDNVPTKVISLKNIWWESHCRELFNFQIAAQR